MSTATKPVEIKPRVGPPPAPPKSGHHPWWLVALETAAFLVVGVAGLEAAMRVCGVGADELLQPDAQMGMKHIPNKPVVWRMEGYSADCLNSAGMRDAEHSIAKPANTYRVALLGDSATEGLQVPQKDTYATALSELLRVPGKTTEVLNFGCSSYSTGQEVLQFEREVAQYKPDLTILLYNRGDAVENTRKPADLKVEPRPYFYLDKAGNLKQDNAVLSHNAAALKPNPPVDWLRRNSRIFGVFSHANLTLSLNEPLYRKLRGWITTPFSPRKPSANAASSQQYQQQDTWKVTSSLIERLRADCAKQDCKLFVVTFPNIVNDPEFAKQIQSVEQLAKKDGFDFYDLTDRFRWNPNPAALFLKYHFSSAGHKFVAERMVEHLNGTR